MITTPILPGELFQLTLKQYQELQDSGALACENVLMFCSKFTTLSSPWKVADALWAG